MNVFYISVFFSVYLVNVGILLMTKVFFFVGYLERILLNKLKCGLNSTHDKS